MRIEEGSKTVDMESNKRRATVPDSLSTSSSSRKRDENNEESEKRRRIEDTGSSTAASSSASGGRDTSQEITIDLTNYRSGDSDEDEGKRRRLNEMSQEYSLHDLINEALDSMRPYSVAEVYSPPRIVEEAMKRDLKGLVVA